MQHRIGPIFWLIILSLFWSATFLFVKVADHDFDPITLMAGRALLSFVFLFCVLLLLKKPWASYLKQAKTQLFFLFAGTMIAYMWYTIAACEKVITASMASFLLTNLVIISWLIAVFFTKEKRFYTVNFIGIIVGVMGVITMLGYRNIFYGNQNIYYALLYISGLICFLSAVAVGKTKFKGIDPFVSITYHLFYAAIILTICSVLFEAPFSHSYHTSSLISVLGVGLVSTGIGYLIFFWLATHVGQVFASLNGYLVPVFGFLLGSFVLHEQVAWHQLIGLAIVFIGVFLTDKRCSKT